MYNDLNRQSSFILSEQYLFVENSTSFFINKHMVFLKIHFDSLNKSTNNNYTEISELSMTRAPNPIINLEQGRPSRSVTTKMMEETNKNKRLKENTTLGCSDSATTLKGDLKGTEKAGQTPRSLLFEPICFCQKGRHWKGNVTAPSRGHTKTTMTSFSSL